MQSLYSIVYAKDSLVPRLISQVFIAHIVNIVGVGRVEKIGGLNQLMEPAIVVEFFFNLIWVHKHYKT